MKILVIIVTYNAMQWAEHCFNSLRNSTIVPDVYVVDNGSTDGTQTYIKQNYSEVRFIQSEKNLGFGKANNLGLQYALDNDYDYVYLLNQDAWVMEDTFEKLIRISKENPVYGILSPFQMEANMKHIDTNFKKHVCSWESSPDLLDHLYLNLSKDVYDVDKVMAAHWFITRACLLKVGGFSPIFPHYGEDGNFSERVAYHGFKVGIVPSLQVVHDRENRKSNKSKIIYYRYISLLGSLSSPFEKGCSKALVNLVFLLFKYKSVAPIKYLFSILINYRKIKRYRIDSMTSECAFLVEQVI